MMSFRTSKARPEPIEIFAPNADGGNHFPGECRRYGSKSTTAILLDAKASGTATASGARVVTNRYRHPYSDTRYHSLAR